MEILDKNDNKEILMKNNELIKTRYSLSLIENRLFMWVLYRLQKTPNGDMMCIIPRSEFRTITKKTNNLTIKGVTKILESILSKKISFKSINEKGDTYEWTKHNLINGYAYNKEDDVFKVYCSERIYNLLTSYYEIDENENMIFKGYTPINLKIYLSLENTVSQRMYELLRLWSKSKHVINYQVDDIKELLMIDDKYDRYNDFKKKVIIPSVEELNKTEMFEVDFNENKTGRKVTSISFRVKDLDERTYFIENNGDTINNTPEKSQNPLGEFFIPDESIFTKGTLLLFKKDFGAYDFTEDYMRDAFWESAAALFEKDDVEKIYNKGYNFFKTTLEDKRTALLVKHIRKEEEKELWRG